MRETIYFLGDLHDSFQYLFNAIDFFKIHDSRIFCVGDIAYDTADLEKCAKLFAPSFAVRKIKFASIRGNHDIPAFFNGQSGNEHFALIPDYHTVTTKSGVIVGGIGGAVSVDRSDRSPFTSWFPDEVLTLSDRTIRPDV
jgi:hypothetical protein